MTKTIKWITAVTALLSIMSAYATTCYSLRSQYCITPNSVVNYHTFFPGDPCYPRAEEPIYVAPQGFQQDSVNRCTVVWSAYPDVPYNRVTASCGFWVHYMGCSDTVWEWWTQNYQKCDTTCTP